MRFSIFFLCSSSLLFADSLSSTLSSQGFTGLINTPNAQVIKENTALFHYNNQFDNNLRNYNYDNPNVSQDDFMTGIGFLSGIEIVGRLTEVGAFTATRQQNFGFEIRDLGVNAKYKLPIDNAYLPNIALGIQDLGSESSYYQNAYVVMDKELGIFRASIGYGKSGDNKAEKRMDGVFSGLEVKVSDWVSTMVEHDGVENHAGLRFSLPDAWTNGLQLNATLARNITEPQNSFALNLAIPLSHDGKNYLKIDNSNKKDITSQKVLPTSALLTTKETTQPNKHKDNTFINIQNDLVKIGFENIRVGHYNNSLYIKCENSIFDHTDIDAFGVIIGTIVKNSKKNQHYIISLLKNNLQTLIMSGESNDFKNYLTNNHISNLKKLQSNLHFSRTFNENSVQFIGKRKNSSFFKPRLELAPGLVTAIGTEVGLFDYIVSLRANAYTTLNDGLTLSAMYEMPLFHSQNFDTGLPLATLFSENLNNRLVNAQLHQTIHYQSLLNTTSIGQFRDSTYGVLNHTNFTTTSGEHGLNLRLGNFKDKNSILDDRNIYIGSYRYFYSPLDLYGEVSYGQYWDQDKGGSLELKRFFGETSVALYYKNTEKSFIGFNLSIPLTWRKSSNSKWGQIKGKKDFSYSVRTVVQSPTNTLTPSNVIVPTNGLELTTHYLDKDRLNGSYIKNHLARMRDAALSY